MKIEEKVELWLKAAEELKEVKENELSLRKDICDHILKGQVKGSKKGTIGRYILNATAKLNQNIDKELLQAIWKELSPAEKASVKFTPSIIAKEYKELPDNSILNRAIDSKPGTPSLELKGIIDT